MDTPNEIAAQLSHELLHADKAKQFRYWAKQEVIDYLKKNPTHVPEGMTPEVFANSLELHDLKFDEDQVDKHDPFVVLTYTGPGVKFIIVNAEIKNIQEGWAKDLINFWSYQLSSPRFRITKVIKMD